MASNGKFSQDLLRILKESLRHLESLLLVSDEEATAVNRLKKQIRTNERLNRELGAEAKYTVTEVAARLWRFTDQLEQLPDGCWTLKRRAA